MSETNPYPKSDITNIKPLQRKLNRAIQLKLEIEVRVKELNQLFPRKKSFFERLFKL